MVISTQTYSPEYYELLHIFQNWINDAVGRISIRSYKNFIRNPTYQSILLRGNFCFQTESSQACSLRMTNDEVNITVHFVKNLQWTASRATGTVSQEQIKKLLHLIVHTGILYELSPTYLAQTQENPTKVASVQYTN